MLSKIPVFWRCSSDKSCLTTGPETLCVRLPITTIALIPKTN